MKTLTIALLASERHASGKEVNGREFLPPNEADKALLRSMEIPSLIRSMEKGRVTFEQVPGWVGQRAPTRAHLTELFELEVAVDHGGRRKPSQTRTRNLRAIDEPELLKRTTVCIQHAALREVTRQVAATIPAQDVEAHALVKIGRRGWTGFQYPGFARASHCMDAARDLAEDRMGKTIQQFAPQHLKAYERSRGEPITLKYYMEARQEQLAKVSRKP